MHRQNSGTASFPLVFNNWCINRHVNSHGSNVVGLQTTATFDEKTDEFIIHSPDLTVRINVENIRISLMTIEHITLTKIGCQVVDRRSRCGQHPRRVAGKAPEPGRPFFFSRVYNN